MEERALLYVGFQQGVYATIRNGPRICVGFDSSQPIDGATRF
jgi:hypothetical protein